MKTKKILATLLATMLIVGSIWTTFAWDDERGERGEWNEYRNSSYERNEWSRYEERSESREQEKNEHRNKMWERGERGENRQSVEPNNGIWNDTKSIDLVQKKAQNKKLRASYKAKFKAKLWSRLDNIPKTKLETIVIIIDTKVLEIQSDTTKTDAQKEKLSTIYWAIRDLITDKISEQSSGSILDSLLK